jgi:hypothetical protein
VTLCVTDRAARRLREWGMTRLVEVEADESPEGWVKVMASFDNEGEAQFIVLGLGVSARVIAPEEFRRRVVEQALAVAGTD